MVTKGIIKSIDLKGNTCTVHMPFFETAGNDSIIETATVSNTPGSYNGYKVGDVVWVAFEDGKMDNPVVIGKLYLGVEAEKADPRGVLNVENSSVSKTASMPADTKLNAEIDDNVPNTTAPYGSLYSIANTLNTLNTDVHQMDRDMGNRFKQISSYIDEQGRKLESSIEQSADEITAKVESIETDLNGKIEENKAAIEINADNITQSVTEINKTIDGKVEELEGKITTTSEDITAKVSKKLDSEYESIVRGLGWNLTKDSWTVNAKDSVNQDIDGDGDIDADDIKTFPIFEITRTGVSIAGDLKLSGYNHETTTTYFQSDSNVIAPEKSAAWSTTIPAWEDGKYIWQRTTTKQWEYNKKTDAWESKITSDNIVCLAGASAASYWLKCSPRTHAGEQQNVAIQATAMFKVGTASEAEDASATLEYMWEGEDTFKSVNSHTFKLENIPNEPAKILNKNLLIRAVRNGSVYDSETIMFSPVNTPVLSLQNDSADLDYDSYGLEKIDKNATVGTTARLLLNNEDVADVKWNWTCDGCTALGATNTATITIKEIDEDVDIATATCSATYKDNLGQNKTLTRIFTVSKNKQGKSLYKIDIDNDFVTIPADENGNIAAGINLINLSTHTLSCYYGDDPLTITSRGKNTPTTNDTKFRIKYTLTNVEIEEASVTDISKFQVTKLNNTTGSILYELYRGNKKVAVAKFEISKLIQGTAATSYWVDYSARVHKGSNQQDPITATAWTKYGSNASVQNNSLKIRYGWRQSNGTFGEYSAVESGMITVPTTSFKNADLIFELGTETSAGGTTTFEVEDSEIITYSPINTPILDLTNDSASLVYKPTGDKYGTDQVSSCATVYLDGQIITDGVKYQWTYPTSANTIVSGTNTNTITVEGIGSSTVEFTCTATISNTAIFKNSVTLTKVFTVSRQIQGEYSINYWLNASSRVHLGVKQKEAIKITAMQKIGTAASEESDESAVLYYKYANDSSWTKVPQNATYYHIFDSSKISGFLFKADDLLIKAEHGGVVYEQETITYSPLNTPTLDLSNDTDVILYSADGSKVLGAPVSSTAGLYLNGELLPASKVSYSWTCNNCVSGVTNNATIEISSLTATNATAICTAIYDGASYSKTFSLSKTLKGDNAISYSIVADHSSIKVNPNTGSITPTSLSVSFFIHNGDNIQPFGNATVKYKIDENNYIDTTSGNTGTISVSTSEIQKQIEFQLLVSDQIVDREIIKVITDGVNGQDGQPGASGADGKDGESAPVLIVTGATQLNGKNPAATIYIGTKELFRTTSSGYSLVVIDPSTSAITESITYNTSNSTALANLKTKLSAIISNAKYDNQLICLISHTTCKMDSTLRGYLEDLGSSSSATWTSGPMAHAFIGMKGLSQGYALEDYDSSSSTVIIKTTLRDSLTTSKELTSIYTLAQGKSTNYYGPDDPCDTYDVKDGDCWFKYGEKSYEYTLIGVYSDLSSYAGKYAYINNGDDFVYQYISEAAINTHLNDGISVAKYIIPGVTEAYTRKIIASKAQELKQWDSDSQEWKDVGGEVIANKVTTTYVNALDITAQAINISGKFKASNLETGSPVEIGGFEVGDTGIYSSNYTDASGSQITEYDTTPNTDGVYIGTDGIRLGTNFSVDAEGKVTAKSLSAPNLTVSGAKITGTIRVGSTDSPIFEANKTNSTVTIGGFSVDDSKIYSGSLGTNRSVMISAKDTSSRFIIADSGEQVGWNFVAGKNFGVRTDPTSGESELYVSKGKIGGCTIDNKGIHSSTTGGIYASKGEIGDLKLSNGSLYSDGYISSYADTPSTEGIHISSDGIKLGTNFSVEKTGSIMAKDGDIGGFTIGPESITATRGNVGYGMFASHKGNSCFSYTPAELTPAGKRVVVASGFIRSRSTSLGAKSRNNTSYLVGIEDGALKVATGNQDKLGEFVDLATIEPWELRGLVFCGNQDAPIKMLTKTISFSTTIKQEWDISSYMGNSDSIISVIMTPRKDPSGKWYYADWSGKKVSFTNTPMSDMSYSVVVFIKKAKTY